MDNNDNYCHTKPFTNFSRRTDYHPLVTAYCTHKEERHCTSSASRCLCSLFLSLFPFCLSIDVQCTFDTFTASESVLIKYKFNNEIVNWRTTSAPNRPYVRRLLCARSLIFRLMRDRRRRRRRMCRNNIIKYNGKPSAKVETREEPKR